MSHIKEEFESYSEESPEKISVPIKNVEEPSKTKSKTANIKADAKSVVNGTKGLTENRNVPVNASPALTRNRVKNKSASKELLTKALNTSITIPIAVSSTSNMDQRMVTIKVKQTEVSTKTQVNVTDPPKSIASAAADEESEEIAPKEKPKKTKNGKLQNNMIDTAINALKTKKGVSLVKIKKYLAETYEVNTEKKAKSINKYIISCLDSGDIIKVSGKGANGSFKLSNKYKIEFDENLKQEIKKKKIPKLDNKRKSTKPPTTLANPKRKSMSIISKRNLTPNKVKTQTTKKAIVRSKKTEISDEANQESYSETKEPKVKEPKVQKPKVEEPKAVKKPAKEKKNNTLQAPSH